MNAQDTQLLAALKELMAELYHSTSCRPTAARLKSFAQARQLPLPAPAPKGEPTAPR